MESEAQIRSASTDGSIVFPVAKVQLLHRRDLLRRGWERPLAIDSLLSGS